MSFEGLDICRLSWELDGCQWVFIDLFCPLQVLALRREGSEGEECYQITARFMISEHHCDLERARELNL
jgi:hypothetical protein